MKRHAIVIFSEILDVSVSDEKNVQEALCLKGFGLRYFSKASRGYFPHTRNN